MYINTKATLINGADYSFHITAIELVYQSYGFIPCHIMVLVINSLGGGDAHTNIQICMHTDICTETICNWA